MKKFLMLIAVLSTLIYMSMDYVIKSRVICPECKVTGLQSTVVESNYVNTDSDVSVYYDELGKKHVHNPLDVRLKIFRCSNYHNFRVSPALCWCGWRESENGEMLPESVPTSPFATNELIIIPNSDQYIKCN